MTAIHVEVKAEHIAAAGKPPGKDAVFEIVDHDPVELAIAEVTGREVLCDQDGDQELATIGQGGNTLVLTLPKEQMAWINRWYAGEPVEPFAFDIEIEAWLVDLVCRKAAG